MLRGKQQGNRGGITGMIGNFLPCKASTQLSGPRSFQTTGLTPK